MIKAHKWACLPTYGRMIHSRYGDSWLSEIAARPIPAYDALADAVVENDQGDFLDALQSANFAEALLLKTRHRAGVMRARFERVYALQRLLRGPECLIKAGDLQRQLAGGSYYWLRVQSELELSACQNMTGDPGGAMAAALRAATLAEHAGLRALQLRALAFITSNYGDLGEVNLMWSATAPALESFWSGPWRGVRGHAFMANLAAAAEQRGNLLATYVFQREATEMLAGDSNTLLRALALSRLASAAFAVGENEQSRRAYLTSADLFGRLGKGAPAAEFHIDADLVQASSLMDTGRYDEANYILGGLSRDYNQMPTQVLQIRFEYLRGAAQARLKQSAESERAFAAAVARASERAASMQTPAGRRAALAIGVNPWRQLLGAQIDRTGDWNAALEIVESFRGIPVGRRVSATRLAQDSIVYTVVGDRIAAWVTTGGAVHGTWLPSSSDALERLAASFLRNCAAPRSPATALTRDGRLLYNALFGPLEPWIGEAGTIAVEAEGYLRLLPLEALVDPSGHRLGERFAFVEAESDAERRKLEAGDVPLTSQDTALVMANPAMRGAMRANHPFLASAETEASFVASLFPQTTLLLRDQATRAHLEQNRGSARLFHFAGHASSTGAGVAVFLAPGVEGEAEVLDANAVEQRDWSRCALVVLAACSTAVGEEPVFGPPTLVQAFLDAGARRVVAARWAVDSETTTAFMKRFYVALTHGASAAQALRSAATITRQSEPHPFYWAAFALYGLE